MSTVKREKFDFNAPGATELRDKIVHGAFKTEGQMVAFPLCFPAVSTPIRADESLITALDVTADGVVYGGTSGYAAHLFVAMFHGVTGMAFDMGVVDGGTSTAAICCGKKQFFAATNGPEGACLVTRDLQETPFSLIQEWGIFRSPYTYVQLPEDFGTVLHAVSTSDREYVVGTTDKLVFRYDFASGAVDVLGANSGSGRLAALKDGSVIGRGAGTSVWRCVPAESSLDASYSELPAGSWDTGVIWATDPETGRTYVADADSSLFAFEPGGGWQGPLAQVPHAPVTSMAVTFDGRVFGSYGTDMQRVFCFDPNEGSMTDIGVAASTLQQRRYCYDYGDAVTGRDGEIIFGERDDLGHLWLYFPRIKNTRPAK